MNKTTRGHITNKIAPKILKANKGLEDNKLLSTEEQK